MAKSRAWKAQRHTARKQRKAAKHRAMMKRRDRRKPDTWEFKTVFDRFTDTITKTYSVMDWLEKQRADRKTMREVPKWYKPEQEAA